MRKILFLVVLLSLPCLVSAYDAEINGIYYNFSGTEAIVTSGDNKYVGDVIIPKSVNYSGTTCSVTKIGDYAFGECSGLTSITFPNTITVIMAEAFYGCSGLTTLTLPNSVTTIESGAFSNCIRLTSVFIPASVNSLYRNVFANCSALVSIEVDAANSVYDSRNNCNAIIAKAEEEIVTGCVSTVIPAGVTSIGVAAFRGCTGLTHIDFPGDLSIINFDAFYGCTGLTSVDFPSTLWHIGENAFNGCTSLTSLYIPKRTTSIGDGAFVGCSGLEAIVVDEENYQYDSRNNCNAIIETSNNRLMMGCKNTVIPNGVTRIEKNAFKNCVGLTSIFIPSSVTDIRNSAFEGCVNLNDVKIPNGVTRLTGSVFLGCNSLVAISIPNSVVTIEGSAFADCTSLRSIYIPASVTKLQSRIFVGCNNLAIIDVDEGNTVYDSRNGCNAIIETATNKLVVGCRNTKIPNNVTIIGESAFQGMTSISNMEIPNSVTSIASRAFLDCTGLASIYFPDNVEAIGERALSHCTSLQQLIIPNSVASIARYAFAACDNLTSVISNITEPFAFGVNAFSNISDNCVLCVPVGTRDAYIAAGWTEEVFKGGIVEAILHATVKSLTQTTVTIDATCETFDEEVLSETIDGIDVHDGTVTLTGLIPGTTYTKTYVVTTRSGEKDSIDVTFTTKDIIVNLEGTSYATSVSLVGSFDAGDAGVSESGFEGYSDTGELIIGGLEPETEYSFTFYVKSREGERTFSKTIQISTLPVEFNVLAPRVVSSGNVVVAAETNIADEEEINVGFEWRRKDWDDDIASKSGAAFLYEGTIEGYIHDLYIHQLWKVRPYYCSGSDKYYYGNWVNFDPSDVSYFEPTVHTYASVEMEGNSARVKGYVMKGSDKVTEQGFKYWKKTGKTSSPLYPQAEEVPADAMTVNVDVRSQSLNATLPNLQENVEYSYVAFVTTDNGTTYYGEEQSFTVDNPDGIAYVYTEDSSDNIVKVYSIGGSLIYSGPENGLQLAKGLYILRYPDGKSKKVVY